MQPSSNQLQNIYQKELTKIHTKDTTWQTKIMEVYIVSTNSKKNLRGNVSDEQAVRKKLSKEFDHELANEPLTPAERHNNKKTKKRQ